MNTFLSPYYKLTTVSNIKIDLSVYLPILIEMRSLLSFTLNVTHLPLIFWSDSIISAFGINDNALLINNEDGDFTKNRFRRLNLSSESNKE